VEAAGSDTRIKYSFDPTTSSTPGENGVMSLGTKRNWLLERVKTDLVAHFDDDDYYAPKYLEEMVKRLINNKADFVKLDGWFMYGEDYSDGTRRDAFVYYDFSDGNYLGWGWTLLYKTSLWGEFKYEDKMFMEEDRFVSSIDKKGYK
jgi:glycosyltransferase involved in cell wall biosynthesis